MNMDVNIQIFWQFKIESFSNILEIFYELWLNEETKIFAVLESYLYILPTIVTYIPDNCPYNCDLYAQQLWLILPTIVTYMSNNCDLYSRQLWLIYPTSRWFAYCNYAV